MSDLIIEVKIDGVPYTKEQMARYQYERTLHVLHELKVLGADIRDGGKMLSHEDINWLEPERAEEISLDVRASLSEQEVLELFKEVEADSQRRWKEFNEDYNPAELHTGITEVTVRGISMQETVAVLGGAIDNRQALGTHPEHYAVFGDISTGQRGMESFGMFGEPVFVHGTGGTEIPEGLPFEKDPSYPVNMIGEMMLKSDNTPIHVGAYHMLRPVENGFDVKSIFFCPGKAPKAIADGHKLHFAIEIANSARFAYASKYKSE